MDEEDNQGRKISWLVWAVILIVAGLYFIQGRKISWLVCAFILIVAGLYFILMGLEVEL